MRYIPSFVVGLEVRNALDCFSTYRPPDWKILQWILLRYATKHDN